MTHPLQKAFGVGLGGLALLALFAATLTFFPELKRYLLIKRM
jgi:hypothetical protein